MTTTLPLPDREPWPARPAVLWLLFFVFVTLLAARDPGVILAAELWGEDGWAWYPEAYIYGVPTLWAPVAGYLQTVSRSVALLGLALPFSWTPTFYNGCALAMQALPSLFLVSSRMARAWPHAGSRLLFALLWIALPNSREGFANLTNSQWHLAALAFLILHSTAPRGWAGRVGDALALGVSGLSGPFCIVLAPIAVVLAWIRRDRATLVRAGIVLASAATQAAFVLATIGDRAPAKLGAGPRMLARILSQQIVLGPLIGQGRMEALQGWWLWQNNVAPLAVSLAAAVLAVLALRRGPLILRMACLFAGLLLAAALARPQISAQDAQWPLMLLPGVGQRYYYVPMLAWLGVLISLAGARGLALRSLAVAILALAVVGIRTDWSHPPRQPTGFAARARAFEAAPSGTTMSFPINPALDGPFMVLQKR